MIINNKDKIFNINGDEVDIYNVCYFCINFDGSQEDEESGLPTVCRECVDGDNLECED